MKLYGRVIVRYLVRKIVFCFFVKKQMYMENETRLFENLDLIALRLGLLVFFI